jgi:tetratricopeptide (TPR) repeat protein
VEILKKGIEKSPQDKSMAIFLADVYKFFGKDSIAIEKYLKCIDLGCAIGEILPNIIEIYRDASMFKEAIAYAEKWKSLDPEHTGPITYLKDLYAKL